MNGKPQTIPPELAKKIQEALASGQPLPPGVVAVRDGQTPPPGAVPMGISTQVPPGGQQAPQTKAAHNPIPDGDEGLKILRAFSSCTIPQEAAKLNRMLQMILQNPDTGDDTADEILTKGLIAAMKANRYCAQNKKARTVCIFSEDPILKELHDKVNAEQANLDRINQEMTDCVTRGNEALTARWKKAVDTYGLNPDKYMYYVNEEKGIIEQVDLKCDECKGVGVIQTAREEATKKLMSGEVPANG